MPRSFSIDGIATFTIATPRMGMKTAATQASPALGQLPERAGQAEPVEDRLVLLARPGAPARVETVAPPGERELPQLRRGESLPGRMAGRLEPARHVLLRPEELHRASGEADVVPPAPGGDNDVEDELDRRRAAGADVHLDRLAAVRARRRDVSVDVQRRGDPERVP